MPRIVFSIIGLIVTIGFGWWRYSATTDFNAQISELSFSAAGAPGVAGDAPPADVATLSTPAGAFNYLNHVAETLAAMGGAESGQEPQLQFAIPGSLSAGTAGTTSAGGGRILSITADPEGAAQSAEAAAAPARVTVIRPRH